MLFKQVMNIEEDALLAASIISNQLVKNVSCSKYPLNRFETFSFYRPRMFSRDVCLLILWLLVFFQGQVEGPQRGRTNRLDPCADDDEPEREDQGAGTSRGWIRSFFSRSNTRKPPSYTAEELKDYGNDYFRDEKFEEALRCFSKAIKMNPNEPKYYRNRGMCLENLNRPYEAVIDYRKSLELEPSNVRGHSLLGRKLFQLELYEEALEHLPIALEYGEERNMMSDEKTLISRMIETSTEKVKEIQEARRKAREHEMLIYFTQLILNDTKRKMDELEESSDEKNDFTSGSKLDSSVEDLKSSRDWYLKELSDLFAQANEKNQSSSREVPEYMCDKISYEVMKDPYTTPSGVTYEKNQILKHLETNRTDPMTRQSLRSNQLRQNKSLKAYIEEYLKQNKLTYSSSFR